MSTIEMLEHQQNNEKKRMKDKELKVLSDKLMLAKMKLNFSINKEIEGRGKGKLIRKFPMENKVLDEFNCIWEYYIEDKKVNYTYWGSCYSEKITHKNTIL